MQVCTAAGPVCPRLAATPATKGPLPSWTPAANDQENFYKRWAPGESGMRFAYPKSRSSGIVPTYSPLP